MTAASAIPSTRARLWAPAAQRACVEIDGVRIPMDPGADGWWEGPLLRPGQRYGFLIDDDEHALYDPRGRRLPDGVHGLSEVDDPSAFPWTDDEWMGRPLAGSCIYEMHVGTFSQGAGVLGAGTLDSAIPLLDSLVDLGIGFIELLPVNAFNGSRNWGYDGVAWFAIDEDYGGPNAYRRLVDAAHARGLGVIQDVVYNHLGPSGNVLPHFGPYLRSVERNTWGSSVNLDEDAVRSFILDNVRMWLEDYHVDGLRLDAVHALRDRRRPHILAEISDLGRSVEHDRGTPVILIAESDLNDPIMFRTRDHGGYGLTAQWSDDFHHAFHVALTGETTGYYADFAAPEALRKVLTRGFFHDGTMSTFRGRHHGIPIASDELTSRLVVFLQDHDQIGNRAIGDRLTEHLSADRLAAAATALIASPFTPMLFMGEEWGATTRWQFFTAHPEEELGRVVAQGRIEEFSRMGWDPSQVPDPQDPDTFLRSRLDRAEKVHPANARLLAVYRDVLRLRRDTLRPEHVLFRDLWAETRADGRAVALHWPGFLVAVNLSESIQCFADRARILFSSQSGFANHEAEIVNVEPDETIIAAIPEGSYRAEPPVS